MTNTFRKINALLKKEFKAVTKNKNIFFMCLLPLIFAVVYSGLIDESNPGQLSRLDVLLLVVGMNLILVSSFVIAMSIAEEKENNTLRTLMLSGVSPMQFLTSKVIVTLIISEVINVAIYFIVGLDTQYLGMFILLTTLVVISMIELGAVIGIIAPNQMSTGIIGMPVLMILWGIPMFSGVNSTTQKIAEFLQLYNMNEMIEKVFSGESLNNSIMNLVVVLSWIVISAIAFAYTYKKVGIDK